ncbi:TapB family protein [Costertonia aggregata]|uniref:DUF3108 domain-containing protein n=1 Tax=Costertonia aggregata TaxID=343403 RepID=A0A7H9ARA8_9FLAO|nr:hypothetical protein [Costertonia aggregata]QLG45937.1 hypothetical protein HYG79_11440 [Costertonia aggregata]
MKSLISHVFALMVGICISNAQSDCSQYYPLEEGATFEYTSYGKKDKVETVANYEIVEVTNSGATTKAIMDITMKDHKGKEIYNTEYRFSCTENKVMIDYESLIPASMLEGYKDMEMEISGTDIELPNNLSVGQELEDANVAVKISMGGMNMNMSVDQINRKVEKQESVTTPAGTFDCMVITNDTKSKMMMANQTFSSRLWLAEGVGMVKQETFNKNGKLMGSTVLTAYSR